MRIPSRALLNNNHLPSWAVPSLRAGALAWLLSMAGAVELVAAPEVILKLDDLRYNASTTVDTRWQRLVDYVEEKKIKASIGIITDSMSTAGDDYFQWIRDVARGGRIEFWHHGYDHSRDSASTPTWWEFKNTDYAWQKEHFELGMSLAEEKLGFKFRTFGAPYNQTDAITVQVLEENPDMRVWLYGDTGATTSKMVLKRIGALNIEISTGVPDFATFSANLPGYWQEPVIVIQGHPGQWDEANWLEFTKIVDFVLEQGASFTTPYGYFRKVNSIPYAILKADNVEYNLASGTPNTEWQRFLDFLRERNIKATAGLRGDTLEDASGIDKQPYYDWLKGAGDDGTIEYFLYGYDHSIDTANSPPLWWEFRNSDYAYQKFHFTRTAELAQEKLGITLRAFGASWNQTDATTVQILEESPEIKVWLYGKASAGTTKLVLERIPQINIEEPVHVPNSNNLEANYPLYSGEPVLVLQGHPADWDTDEAFAEFVAIVDYLDDQGVVFTTPSEYYEILYPSGVLNIDLGIDSEEGVRYQWLRSSNLTDWERWGNQFIGTGARMSQSALYSGDAPAFYRCEALPADAPLLTNTFEDLTAFQEIVPGAPNLESGVVLVDEGTVPANLAGTGSGLRFYDYSTTVGGRAFMDLALPKAFKLEILFYNNNYQELNPFHGPTLRFGNTGAGLQASTSAAFYVNFRTNDFLRAYYAGGSAEVAISAGTAHRLTIYANGDTAATVTYEGPAETRTLNPMSFEVYVDDVPVGSTLNGMPFINPAGYIIANGIGRIGLNTSSTHVGADWIFDDLFLSPIE